VTTLAPSTEVPTSTGSAARRHPAKRRMTRRRWRTAGAAAAFLAPSLVLLLAFWIGPMLGTAWVSLQDWNLLGKPSYVGLDNYRELATDDEFHAALGHTVSYLAGYLALVLVFGLAVALLLDAKLPAMTLFRAMFFLPVISSWVAISLLWKWLLNPAEGLVNRIIEAFGLTGPGWWTDPDWAIPSVVLASVWKDVGFVAVTRAVPAVRRRLWWNRSSTTRSRTVESATPQP
jgi:multiple sugar transport system permease protein